MATFYIDPVRELEIAKEVRKNSLKWKLGNALAVVFTVAGLVILVPLVAFSEFSGFELAAAIAATLLIPALGVCISLAVAHSYGRDILLTRSWEEVRLSEDYITEVYTPRYRTTEPFTQVVNKIPLSDITDITYDTKNHRYIIQGRIITGRRDLSARQLEPEEREGEFVLYDYFYNSLELREHLKLHSQSEIKDT